MPLHLFFSLIVLSLCPLALHAEESVEWTYDKDHTGQDDWGDMSKEFAACGYGTAQSPIQISYTKEEVLPPLNPQYHKSPGRLRYTGRAIEIILDNGNTLDIDGNQYQLKMIQFHSPGEHMIKDTFYPLEMGFLHETADGKRLIMSVYATVTQHNPALEPIVAKLPATSGIEVPIEFDVAALMPASRGYYSYTGSLTTPPCTEGIEWRIFKQPVAISNKQLAALAKLTGRNARLPQPVYMRIVKETKD